MTKYVFSTLSTGTTYVEYHPRAENDLPRAKKKFPIRGGANVITKGLITPLGVMTPVTDEDYEILKTIPLFQMHMKKGFIRVEDAAYHPERVAADMSGRAEDAQMVEADLDPDSKAPKLRVVQEGLLSQISNMQDQRG